MAPVTTSRVAFLNYKKMRMSQTPSHCMDLPHSTAHLSSCQASQGPQKRAEQGKVLRLRLQSSWGRGNLTTHQGWAQQRGFLGIATTSKDHLLVTPCSNSASAMGRRLSVQLCPDCESQL